MLSFLNSDFNLDHAYRAELRGLQLTRQTGFLACKNCKISISSKTSNVAKSWKRAIGWQVGEESTNWHAATLSEYPLITLATASSGKYKYFTWYSVRSRFFFLARVVCFFIIDHVIFSWELSFNPSKSYSFIYTWLFEDLKARRCELRNKPPKQTKES